ncbi:hypothetical protein F4780DRAFT_774835 [Xylariomycetidae sp. FL0641]|nr:hypothetical protein F4780DRAFT_774835 [Xylariomycetidae sp. FL0641]
MFMALPSEVILVIVEFMDTTTRQAFMATNTAMRRLVPAYEHSIAKANAAKYPLPPAGLVLSTTTPALRGLLCPVNSFALVRELEVRQSRIKQLVKSKYFVPFGLWPLTYREYIRLDICFERALLICDAIGDIAANLAQDPIAAAHVLQATQTGNVASKIPLRRLQRAYIRSLSLPSTVVVLFLVSTMSSSYSKSIGYGLSDPSVIERLTVFEECVLRHGSWFLRAHIQGNPAEAAMAKEMIGAGMNELTQWEAGSAGALPGLKVALLDRFKELTKTRYHAIAKVLSFMHRMVRGAKID